MIPFRSKWHDQHSLIVYVIVMVCPSLNLKSEWKEKMIQEHEYDKSRQGASMCKALVFKKFFLLDLQGGLEVKTVHEKPVVLEVTY